MTNKIAGVSFNTNSYSIACHVTELSESLKECIRNHLTKICHGKALSDRNLTSNNYTNTLKQFHDRYSDKTDKQKKGIIGELLSHVLISEYLTEFEIISPFFNMEEKSQRKGFDLILYSPQDDALWITEVKSGELNQSPSPDAATRSYLHTAKNDLNTRLNQPESTFWSNAINSVNNAIADCKDYKEAVLQILDYEKTASLEEFSCSKDNNVILISVLFHDTKTKFNINTPKEIADVIKGKNIFKDVITLSIQKNTYQKIEHFLFEEELDGQ